MENRETPPPSHPPSATRFNMRALLGFSTVVAIVASFAGWYFRSQPPEVQGCLTIFWGSIIVFSSVFIFGCALHRRQSEKKLGKVFFRVNASVWVRLGLGRPWVTAITTWLLAASLLIALSLVFSQSRSPSPPFGIYTIASSYAGWFVALGAITTWWSRELWIGEHGFVWLSFFRPWKRIIQWQWHSCDPNVIELDYRYAFHRNRLLIALPQEQGEEERLLNLLREKVGPPMGDGSEPIEVDPRPKKPEQSERWNHSDRPEVI